MRLFFIAFFAPFVALCQECDSVPDINLQILNIAQSKVKKKVGRGECWDLIQLVLNESNAKWDGYENFGNEVNWRLECVMPGDIISFNRVKLKYEENGTVHTEAMAHHFAVIAQIVSKEEWTILDQNTALHGRKVGISPLKISSIYTGKIKVYRPMPNQ